MKKNYLHVVLWLVLLVVIALLAMNRMPQLSLFGNKLKEVDILADLKGVGSVADTEDAMLADMIEHYQCNEIDFYQFDMDILQSIGITTEGRLKKLSEKLHTAYQTELLRLKEKSQSK